MNLKIGITIRWLINYLRTWMHYSHLVENCKQECKNKRQNYKRDKRFRRQSNKILTKDSKIKLA